MNYFLAYLAIGLVLTLAHTFLKPRFMKELDAAGTFDHVADPHVGLILATRALTILIVGSLAWPVWVYSAFSQLSKEKKS